MNAIEIFLIVAGIICVIVSVVMNFSDQSDKKEVTVSTDLTDEQKNKIKQQIDTIIDDQVNGCLKKQRQHLIRYLIPKYLK